ncbi:hypothetical protein [Halorubrum tebenquichense]|uniref:Uncharacterized protein n=1 Tax=Halorubrum tebenquichense DSM 14210 TaxID=1227485 RepID=M0DV47_9EURY|nr:hypothetical protein [Halorubrum tebenquichense]ELZ38562.1 hypothetical protein C472_06809 [Halorubrum tebenquichense DSM 14210]
MSLRSRLLGPALLVVGVGALGLAGTVSSGFVPSSSAPDGIAFVTPSPVSSLATPALLAAGSVLLVGGTAAAGGTDASARAALVAPALSTVAAFAFGVGLFLAPASVPETATNPAAQAALLSELPALHVAGAVVGSAVAPVVQATVTEDTPALLAGSILLLAAVAVGASHPLSLVTGGVGGAAAVGLLWAVDPDRWRP